MDGIPARNRHYIVFTRPRARCLQRGAIAMARDLPAVFNGAKPVQTGRDGRGRFVAGAPPGPGRPANPYARQQAALRVAVLAAVEEGDLRAVVRKVLHLAKRGSIPAAECLFKWIIGPPPEPTHPDFLRAHEFAARRAQPSLVDELALAERPPLEDQAADPDAEDGPEEEFSLPNRENAAAVHPQLREMLMWAVQQLAEAQTRPALPPPPDPVQSWETFAATRLQWDPEAAVPVDLLYLTYARWAAARGEPVLAAAPVLAWLRDKGATLRTGTFSRLQDVAGVRLVE
jgi:hypothetical protein